VNAALGAVGEGLFELGLDEDGDGAVRRGYGGDVANVCVMAARAGAAARLSGRVGADALGRALLEFWRSEGVDVEHIRVDPDAPTGIYVNERTREGAHRFDYHRRGSAGSRLAPADLTQSFFSGLAILHTSGISLAVCGEATAAAVAQAAAGGALVSFAVNHRPALGGGVETVTAAARAADIVFVSVEEASELWGQAPAELSRLGEVRAALGDRPREIVITAAAEGAAVAADGESITFASPSVEAVDAAGAGDALAGAYLAARLDGHDPATALRRGVAAAALSCRSFGCALSYPSAAEVDALA
jgi:2-dehydro-3-deoxygluconokinase